jgi:Spy/CpxP family protein refolding chaperone
MVTILIAFVLVNIKVSAAQRTFPSNTKPNLRMDSQGTCWESSSLTLTEAQKKALETLHRAYMTEAIPIRTGLFALKIELRHLLSDPNIQPQILFDQQRKISELQAKLESLSLSYQIKARSIFTKEQWEQLPQDCSLGMEVGFGMGTGISRGPRKELH